MKTLLFPLFALALAATACGRPFEAKTPSGYVELEDQDDAGYDYRAVSADGVVLSVRAIDHDPQGELPFWTRVVENHLRQRGGYALIEQRAVKTQSGLAGAQLCFGHDEGSKPHLYYVTVFVTKDWIYLLEAGGTKELMTKNAAELERAVSEFRAK